MVVSENPKPAEKFSHPLERVAGFSSLSEEMQKQLLAISPEKVDAKLLALVSKKATECMQIKIENQKDAEARTEKVETVENKIQSASESERGVLQVEIAEKEVASIQNTPLTADNAGEVAGRINRVVGIARNVGIESAYVEITPQIQKSLHKVIPEGNSFKFDLIKQEVKVAETTRSFPAEDLMGLIMLDKVFAHQIPDNLLAKIDRQDIVKLADILDKEASKDNLTPQSIRGFQALAQLAQFNITELIRVGIFDKDMRLDEDKAKAWVDANAAELRETRAINVANLSWERRENSPAIAA